MSARRMGGRRGRERAARPPFFWNEPTRALFPPRTWPAGAAAATTARAGARAVRIERRGAICGKKGRGSSIKKTRFSCRRTEIGKKTKTEKKACPCPRRAGPTSPSTMVRTSAACAPGAVGAKTGHAVLKRPAAPLPLPATPHAPRARCPRTWLGGWRTTRPSEATGRGQPGVEAIKNPPPHQPSFPPSTPSCSSNPASRPRPAPFPTTRPSRPRPRVQSPCSRKPSKPSTGTKCTSRTRRRSCTRGWTRW